MRAAGLFLAIASAAGCARQARAPGAPLTLADCERSRPAPPAADETGGGATPMVMRLDADLTDSFALSAVCLRVDGQRVYLRRLETPAPIHARADVPVRLRSAMSHTIELVAEYGGTRDFAGYRLSIASVHHVTPENVPDGVVGMHILDRGSDKLFEQRPTVEWSVPSDRPPTGVP